MDSCDVLIVGGGPAGSSCAWGLRNTGLDVLILDRQTFPRDKTCAGWITPRVLTALEIDPNHYARDNVLQPITAFVTGAVGGPSLRTDYASTVSYGIRRREFDDYLLRRAKARLLLGTPLQSLERDGSAWIANDTIRTRLVVGAGGHFCPVAHRQRANDAAVVAQEVEFRLNPRQLHQCPIRPDTPELYFSRDMKGYGWCFRKGDFLNIGLGRADTRQLPSHISAFLDFLRASGRLPFELPPLRGHAYLLRGVSTRRPSDDGILLVGDAAGLAYPQSGEGILPAIESGLLAARIVAAARGSYTREALSPYEFKLNHSPSLPQAPWAAAISRLLLKSPWFVRHVLLNRCFLHTATAG